MTTTRKGSSAVPRTAEACRVAGNDPILSLNPACQRMGYVALFLNCMLLRQGLLDPDPICSPAKAVRIASSFGCATVSIACCSRILAMGRAQHHRGNPDSADEPVGPRVERPAASGRGEHARAGGGAPPAGTRCRRPRRPLVAVASVAGSSGPRSGRLRTYPLPVMDGKTLVTELRVIGSSPASSSAAQATSSIKRCWASISSASRGVTRKGALSNRSASRIFPRTGT